MEVQRRPFREYLFFYVAFLSIIGGALGGLYYWENQQQGTVARAPKPQSLSVPQTVLVEFASRLKAGNTDGALELVSPADRDAVRTKLDVLNRAGEMDAFLGDITETARKNGSDQYGKFVIKGPLTVRFAQDENRAWFITSFEN